MLDDYNELLFVETLLKKVGFDCMGLQSEQKIADTLLAFNPQLLITEAAGRKVNGYHIAQKLKKKKGLPQQLLIVNPTDRLDDDELRRLEIGGAIHRPVHPNELSEQLGRLLSADVTALKEKFQRLGLFQDRKSEDRARVISGKGEPKQLAVLKESPLTDDDRALRGRKAIESLPEPRIHGLDRKQVVQQVKEFRIRENDSEIQEIDEERMDFAKQLFKRS